MTARIIGSIVLCAVVLCPAVVRGEKPEATLSAQGWASLEKMPEIMRLKLDIQASAPELPQALAKLKEKREAAVKKLKDMGAPAEAIVFEGPTLVPDQTDAMKRQMAMMRGQDTQEEDKEEAKPAKVNVMITLKLDLPLQTADTEALLVTVHQLQERIRKADLAGLKDEKPSEEEQEEQAEMKEQMMNRFGGDNQPAPGEPTFLFVWKMSDAEHAKLLAEAFANAKTDAQRLAAAAAVQLGPLVSVTGQTMSVDEDSGRSYAWNPIWYQAMQRARAMSSTESAEKEALGVLPQKIAKRVVVSVSYALQ